MTARRDSAPRTVVGKAGATARRLLSVSIDLLGSQCHAAKQAAFSLPTTLAIFRVFDGSPNSNSRSPGHVAGSELAKLQ
jgi:hypothetical protein